MKIKTYFRVVVAAVVLAVTVPAWAQYPGGGYPQQFYGAQAAYAYGPSAYATAPAGYYPGQGYGMQTPAMEAAFAESQAAGGCDSCGTCGECTSCGTVFCGNCCGFRVSFFGDYLYLRARDSEVTFAVEENGSVTAPPDVPLQQSRIAMLDQDFDSGFRAGFTLTLDPCSSITAQYTMFEADTTDYINNASNPANAIFPMSAHPGTLDAAGTGTQASAYQLLSFDLLDVDYRGLMRAGPRGGLNYVVGVRSIQLEQNFNTDFEILSSGTVATDIDFTGAGLRLGLEGESQTATGLSLYGRGIISLVAGEFDATYTQTDVANGTRVSTNWNAGRIVPILDLEVGATWCHPCRNLSFSAGYLYSFWYNTVKTDEWINAVQRNNFVNLGDSMTFDGLMARVEGRF